MLNLRVLKIQEKILKMAKYRGRTVKLNKPMRGDVKKFKSWSKNYENKKK